MGLAEDIAYGKQNLTEEEIVKLNDEFYILYQGKTNAVRTPSSHVVYVGDLHGDLDAAKYVRDLLVDDKRLSVVFMGDYVDRGSAQIQTINLILALAIRYPKRVTVLRGNHESEEVSGKYGFYMSVSRIFNDRLYKKYMSSFSVLPLVGISKDGVFSCHGGIPQDVHSRQDLEKFERRYFDFPHDIAFQIVWNDPRNGDFDFRPNFRSERARYYGKKAFDEFIDNLDLRLMLRAHEVQSEGVKRVFNGQLLSVFSTSYNGRVKPKVVYISRDKAIEEWTVKS